MTQKSAHDYKCKKWSAGPHFSGWCRLCLVLMGLDPDSDPSFSAAQPNPLNVIQPPPSQNFQPSDEASLTTPQAPNPSAPQAATPSTTSESPMSAGTKAHFQSIGKEKQPQDPNLKAHLKHQLGEIFSPELIKKSLVITPLPTNLLSQITVSHGEKESQSPLKLFMRSQMTVVPNLLPA
ncbi:alphaK I8 [Puccinia sorghi]|uniref:AlphaK I8 n=1 Tax=Puccinia sorghi TaxID=27349 RepID=A0A0L6V5N6_9BASI|nr:alphaK I8 [Puccinia sorghi]